MSAIPPDDCRAFPCPLHSCFPVAGGGFPVWRGGVPGSDAVGGRGEFRSCFGKRLGNAVRTQDRIILSQANAGWAYGKGRWAYGDGRWPSGDGRLPSGDGRWPSGDGRWPSGNGRLPSGNGRLPSGDGRWAYGNGTLPSGREGWGSRGEDGQILSISQQGRRASWRVGMMGNSGTRVCCGILFHLFRHLLWRPNTNQNTKQT